MLAVPRALLDVLKLRAGAEVDIGIEDGRLIVAPRTRPSYTVDELLDQRDDTAAGDRGDCALLEASPVDSKLLWCSEARSGWSASTPLAVMSNKGLGRSWRSPPLASLGQPGHLPSRLSPPADDSSPSRFCGFA